MGDKATVQSADRKSEDSGGGDLTRASEVDTEFHKTYGIHNPEYMTPPTHAWIWLLLGVIAVVGVTAGITLGVSKPSQPLPKVSAKVTEPDLYISSFSGEVFVLLVGEEGVYDQIKVTTTTTNTVNVRDLTQGAFKAKSAALNAQRNRVAYIREENGHRYAVVVELATGADTFLDGDQIKVGPLGNVLEPCTWSPISWSPNGESFAFFGCDRSKSYVIIVQASTELTPFVVKDTESSQSLNRQVFWSNDQNLLFSSVDPTTNRSWIGRVEAKADAAASPIYSR